MSWFPIDTRTIDIKFLDHWLQNFKDSPEPRTI